MSNEFYDALTMSLYFEAREVGTSVFKRVADIQSSTEVQWPTDNEWEGMNKVEALEWFIQCLGNIKIKMQEAHDFESKKLRISPPIPEVF